MRKINVFAPFNGVGGAMMALDDLNVPVATLFSSEIDKFAIQGAQSLFPDTLQIGDIISVRKAVCYSDRELTAFFENAEISDEEKEAVNTALVMRGVKIDLIMAGFPCQAWSLAGKQKGDDDPRGALVHELLALWHALRKDNPSIAFMFENVAMKQEFMDYINMLFGTTPVTINSALVTAQNRKRNYWCNWDVGQPEDRGLVLSDILLKHSGKLRPCVMRDPPPAKASLCHHIATATDIKGNEAILRVYAESGKSPTLTTMGGGHREPKVLVTVGKYRKISTVECMLLQGFPTWVIDKLYDSGLSDTQLKKMTGNGWSHPVIVHILNSLLDSGWREFLT